ncbi:MAG TPA: 2'-5' RNA ligase family protein [Chitinophagaceae bacterium]|nr:2'-5' RNA ligase family protein [Chitinophagaceae bacterium]
MAIATAYIMEQTGLYFIAILPPPQIMQEVTAIKQEFAGRFQSRHALKVPPHITLKEPFQMLFKNEAPLSTALNTFFNKFDSFEIALRNFGCFANKQNPVIFIQPDENLFLQKLYQGLMDFLQKTGFFRAAITRPFHPHMTVAYRDLSMDNFKKAWLEFSKRTYYETFSVTEIWLLHHTGNVWIPYQSFTLK